MDWNLKSHTLDQSLACAKAWLSGKEVQGPVKNLSYLASKEAKALLNRFKFPLANRYIETLIRRAVQLPSKEALKQSHLKEAVISALMHPLRQVIGSCFATAPAIYIQNEKPDRLLLDLYDLIMTAKIKRTFGGNEYIIPISPKWGNRKGDHPLLRVWEYTIASFCDYKKTFSQWTLFSSLGLDPKEEGGIGHFLYSILETLSKESKKEMEGLDQTYREAIDTARASETLLRQADSYEKARMRRTELQVHLYHAEACKERRDHLFHAFQALLDLFPFLIESYSKKFQEYFVEIFDPDISLKREELYEDSPAGFRLVYKHGRRDPNTWTFLQDAEDFFKALRHFFLAVEPELFADCAWEGGKKAIERVTTELVHFIETKPFQTFALKKKTPWSYSSGGSLHTLLKGYFRIEGEIEEEKRIITSPLDLLTFILDVLKSLPYSITQTFEKTAQASLFMYSPTHAFLLKPGLAPFKEGWIDTGFTYTWIRDQIIAPAKKHYASIEIDQNMQKRLASRLIQTKFFPTSTPLSLPEFRSLLAKAAPNFQGAIDSLLYHSFSLSPPLIFADTNWEDSAFAFAVNPATFELDLYRCSANGKNAYPMEPWRPYLDGTLRKHWGILTRPDTYGLSLFSDLPLNLKKI